MDRIRCAHSASHCNQLKCKTLFPFIAANPINECYLIHAPSFLSSFSFPFSIQTRYTNEFRPTNNVAEHIGKQYSRTALSIGRLVPVSRNAWFSITYITFSACTKLFAIFTFEVSLLFHFILPFSPVYAVFDALVCGCSRRDGVDVWNNLYQRFFCVQRSALSCVAVCSRWKMNGSRASDKRTRIFIELWMEHQIASGHTQISLGNNINCIMTTMTNNNNK